MVPDEALVAVQVQLQKHPERLDVHIFEIWDEHC